MTITHGTWGDRHSIFTSDSSIVTVLKLKGSKRCSWHKHAHSFNHFFVISGVLGIKTDIGNTLLHPGESFTVPPGVFHEFQTPNSDAIVVEIAYTRYNSGDIIRQELGGDYETEQKKNR